MQEQLARVLQWLRQPENALFCVLIALHLIPIWAFRYFPSQDGPAHLNNANVLREYYLPDLTVFREYYTIKRGLMPNWTVHLILAGLMSAVPQLVAEKLLLSGYVILFPVSIRYALRAMQPQAGALAFLGFPFVYNYTFHMGFYNFSYSLPMMFFVLGYWMKHQEHFGLRQAVGLSFLALILYFSHIVSLGIAWIALALMGTWLTLADIRRVMAGTARWTQLSAWKSVWTCFRSRALFPLCALLPTVALSLVFLGQQGSSHTGIPPVSLQWQRLRVLESLVSHDVREFWFSKATVLLFAGAAIFLLADKTIRRQWSRWDGWLAVSGVLAALYFLVPDGLSGGGYLSARLMLFPFFAALLWFGAQTIPRFVRRGSSAVALVIALGLFGLHFRGYAEVNRYLDEYSSGSHLIARNSTLLALPFERFSVTSDGRHFSRRVGHFRHASGYLAADRRVVDFQNFFATTGYFPIQFRGELDPFQHIGVGRFETQPPWADFITYSERTGGRVDYVLVWQTRDHMDQEAARSICQQLSEGYDLIFTSPQNGFMRLYRRKGWNPDLGESGR